MGKSSRALKVDEWAGTGADAPPSNPDSGWFGARACLRVFEGIEERVIVVRADSREEAVISARRHFEEYAEDTGAHLETGLHVYAMWEDLEDGAEVFSVGRVVPGRRRSGLLRAIFSEGLRMGTRLTPG